MKSAQRASQKVRDKYLPKVRALSLLHAFCDVNRASPESQGVESTRISSFYRAALCCSFASAEILRDPARADLIGVIGEISSDRVLSSLYNRMRLSEQGRFLLLEKTRVTNATLIHARSCSTGTFGEAYAHFMDTRAFRPEDRPETKFSVQKPWHYVLVRLREIHDYLHVLFDCPTNIEGEVILKAIEFANFKLPVSCLGALVGSVQLPVVVQHRLHDHFFPWATRAGLKCEPLESIHFESSFNAPLQEVRKLHGIITLPK